MQITDQELEHIRVIVMGQLRHTLHEHPEFFTDKGKRRLSSISKRVSGDVIAYISRLRSKCGKSASS